MSKSPTVMLKNGVEEASGLVAATMLVLNKLWDDFANGGLMAVYELHKLCKDPDYRPFGTTADRLVAEGLVTRCGDGFFKVDHSTRNIVLSAIEGDAANMTLGLPVAK